MKRDTSAVSCTGFSSSCQTNQSESARADPVASFPPENLLTNDRGALASLLTSTDLTQTVHHSVSKHSPGWPVPDGLQLIMDYAPLRTLHSRLAFALLTSVTAAVRQGITIQRR